MAKLIREIGNRHGMLVVISRARNVGTRASWNCMCDCGKESIVIGKYLRNGDTKSCGCLFGESHDESADESYVSWAAMRTRCNNPNSIGYKNYGGRGIEICDRWNKFSNFYKDMGDRPKGLSLDRIDNDGDYEPSNCRWATRKEQSNNKRNSRFLTHNGCTLNIAQWAKRLGFAPTSLRLRLNRGWSTHRALTEPMRDMNNKRV